MVLGDIDIQSMLRVRLQSLSFAVVFHELRVHFFHHCSSEDSEVTSSEFL